jgi:hypothetical protein
MLFSKELPLTQITDTAAAATTSRLRRTDNWLLVVIEIFAEKQENLFLNVLSGLQSINALLLLNHDLKTGSIETTTFVWITTGNNCSVWRHRMTWPVDNIPGESYSTQVEYLCPECSVNDI